MLFAAGEKQGKGASKHPAEVQSNQNTAAAAGESPALRKEAARGLAAKVTKNQLKVGRSAIRSLKSNAKVKSGITLG